MFIKANKARKEITQNYANKSKEKQEEKLHKSKEKKKMMPRK